MNDPRPTNRTYALILLAIVGTVFVALFVLGTQVNTILNQTSGSV